MRSLGAFRRLIFATPLALLLAAALLFAVVYFRAPIDELHGTWEYVPDGSLLPRETGLGKPGFTPFEEISGYLLLAVLLSEDHRFATHHGLDFTELQIAIGDSVIDGRPLRGASTISQQLVKNLFLDHGRRLDRKLVEAVYAARLEQDLEKQQILALYLDIVELGEGIYGVKEASRHYFDLEPAALDLEQAAILATLLPNPRLRGRELTTDTNAFLGYLEPRLYRLHRVLVELELVGVSSSPGSQVLELPLPEIVASEPSPAQKTEIEIRVRDSVQRFFSASYEARLPTPLGFEL